MDYRIFPPEEILETTVALPVSKSMAVRDIMLSYFSGNVGNALALADACDDTHILFSILDAGLPFDGSRVDVGAAGTAMRFLTAAVAATDGAHCLITGTERMCRRPIGVLVDALRSLGADIEYRGEEGFPPLEIKGRRLKGGSVDVETGVSSQFLSALMMAAPLMEESLTIVFRGNLQSLPYINMTAAMMRHYGVDAEVDRDKAVVPAGKYVFADPMTEPDWSAAAFWYEIAALTAGWVTLPGLKEDSLQGDRGEASLFERLGALTEFTDDGAELSATPDLWSVLEADLGDMPDAVPALAVTAAMAGLRFRMTGVGVLREKECDRLQALVDELAKVGILLDIENYGNTLAWDGRRVPVRELPVFDPHGDHRMAMALAPVSVFIPGIVVRDVEVVAKSYPSFWQDLAAAGFAVADAAEVPEQKEEQQ